MSSQELHPHSDYHEIVASLARIADDTSPHNNTFLNPGPVAFRDGKARSMCQQENKKLCETFAEWISTKLDGAKHRAGMFVTHTMSPVGLTADELKDEGWHAWGAMLCADPAKPGKILIIWDPDGNLPGQSDADLRYGSLMGSQKALVMFCKTRYKVNEVWLGGSRNPSGKCLEMTRGWLARIMASDREPFEEREVRGFRLVRP